jgi:dipeptidyl aminopeptidase/acylaminoacyl peptidase
MCSFSYSENKTQQSEKETKMKPKLQGVRRFTRLVLLITAVLALSLPVLAEDTPRTAIPLEIAFRETTFSMYDLPAQSADGRYVAYTTFEPTYLSEIETGPHALLKGTHLHIHNFETGESMPIAPDKEASFAASWSPDSTQLAYYVLENDGLAVYLYDVASGTSRLIAAGAIDDGQIGGTPAWHPDGQVLAVALAPEGEALDTPEDPADMEMDGAQVLHFTTHGETADDPLNLDAFPSAEIVLIDVRTGTAERLTTVDTYTEANAPIFSPSGDWLAVPVNRRFDTIVEGGVAFDLIAVQMTDRQTFSLDTSLEFPESQLTGATFMGWHPDQDRFFYFKQGQLFQVDFAAQDAPSEPGLLGSANQTLTGSTLALSRDGSNLFTPLAPSAANKRVTEIQVIPLDGSSPSILTMPKGTHFNHFVKADAMTAWEPEPNTVTILGFDASAQERILVRFNVDDGSATLLRSGRETFTSETWYFSAASPDHSTLLTAYQNFSTPAALVRVDSAFSQITPLITVDIDTAGFNIGHVEFFQTPFTDDNGTQYTLSSAVLLPPDAQLGDDLPVIVEQYGGADLSMSSVFYGGGVVGSIPTSIFTTRGYAVVMVEIPLVPEGQAQDIRTAIANAVVTQVEQGVELGYINRERLAVTGQSFGGYGVASVLSATDLFKAGVAVAGIYDLPSTYAWNLDDFGIYWSTQGQGRMLDTLWQAPERYVENSPYFHANKIHTPLLLVHGEQDTTCPYQESQKMFVALRNLERDAEFLLYARGGHVIMEWPLEDAVDVTERILEFLDKHLN